MNFEIYGVEITILALYMPAVASGPKPNFTEKRELQLW